jgi:hypothetical protein
MADVTVLTQKGEEWVVDLMAAVTQYGTWGTGAGTADKSDIAMFTEGSEARVSTTITQPLADKVQHVWLMTADAGKTITNAGIWSAITVGTLYYHASFTGIVLSTGDKIEFTLTNEVT